MLRLLAIWLAGRHTWPLIVDLAACNEHRYKPRTPSSPMNFRESSIRPSEGITDGDRAYFFDPQARRDRAQPDRRHQCRDRESGPAHRCPEAHANFPRTGREVLRGPSRAAFLS